MTPVLLTGDHERAARHIAGELGIGTFQAECLPEDKLTWIDRSSRAAIWSAWWGTASTTLQP